MRAHIADNRWQRWGCLASLASFYPGFCNSTAVGNGNTLWGSSCTHSEVHCSNRFWDRVCATDSPFGLCLKNTLDEHSFASVYIDRLKEIVSASEDLVICNYSFAIRQLTTRYPSTRKTTSSLLATVRFQSGGWAQALSTVLAYWITWAPRELFCKENSLAHFQVHF